MRSKSLKPAAGSRWSPITITPHPSHSIRLEVRRTAETDYKQEVKNNLK
jgi:hypothetical protein